MKKQGIIILVGIIAAIILASVFFFSLRDRNIVGVTTYPDKNMVVLNSKTGNEFVNGSGEITVGENEYIHMEYDLKSGSFDLALCEGNGDLSVFRDIDMSNLPDPDTAEVGSVCGTSDIKGKGSRDYKVPAGKYTVFFTIHDTVGSADVSVRK